MTPMSPETRPMRDIENDAQRRALEKAAAAQNLFRRASSELAELVDSPLFGNGIAEGLSQSQKHAEEAASTLAAVQTLIASRFRRESTGADEIQVVVNPELASQVGAARQG